MKISIEPYNPEWTTQFEKYKSQLNQVLSSKVCAIEHVGSTSIIGLSAKPVIDILVGVKNAEALIDIDADFINAGFTYIKSEKHQQDQRRTFFRYHHAQGEPAPEIVDISDRDLSSTGFMEVAHIHCWIWDSHEWTRHLAFRDYLKAHDDIRLQYQQLKEELSQKEWESTFAYSKTKGAFIKEIEGKAIEWYQGQTR